MTGLLNSLGYNNAFTQFIDSRRNALGQLGAGIASGTNFGQGIALGTQGALQGRQMDDAYATAEQAKTERTDQINKTVEYLKQSFPDLAEAVARGVPIGDVFTEAWKRQSGTSDPYTLSPGQQRFDENNNLVAGVAGAGDGADGGVARFETGFTPVQGTYNDKPSIAFPGNDGRLYVDGKPIDAGQFIPTNPYDLNAQKAGGSAFGKATGGAQFSVPDAKLELDQSNAALSNLRTDPNVLKGMDDWFNAWGALPRGVWVQGGSNLAQFQNSANNVIDRSWLSARAALKGGGQITDYEGAKAENAVSMMKSALDSGSKSQFESARDDYEYWVQQGFAKLQQQAGGIPGYGASGGSGGPAVGSVEDGHRFKGGDPSVQANWEAVQ